MAEQKKRLTEMVRNCGCAAKLGPGALRSVVGGLEDSDCEDLIIGLENSDDAAAYRLPGGEIILQTLDFFPPIVDDPYTYGQIAATNALSDVYAMGGRPLTAMNIVCYPQNEDLGILAEILRGGADKVHEAGAVIVGGHSVDDNEPKYGLSITGITDAGHLRGNTMARAGDVLILTKAIGTGVIVSAIKGGIVPAESEAQAIASMTSLNKTACEVMSAFDGVHGVTDITGFSLAGHGVELAKGSGLTAVIESQAVPFISGALELAAMGIVPGGTYRNRKYFGPECELAVDGALSDLMFDPQTSGGLLISVAEEQAQDLLTALKKQVTTPVAAVGRLMDYDGRVLRVR